MFTDVEGLHDSRPAGARRPPRRRPRARHRRGGADGGRAGSERSVAAWPRRSAPRGGSPRRASGRRSISGRRAGALLDLLPGAGRHPLPPEPERLSGARPGSPPPRAGKGLDPGRRRRRRALTAQGRSLLPSGVRGVTGQFGVGDAVDIAVDARRPFARGLAGYGADEVRRIAGLKTSEI